jgi:chorismate synthase
MRLSLFGESHGPAVGVVIEGLPSGIPLSADFIRKEMARRSAQGGLSTARRERDEVKILSGVFEGRTTGTPLCALIENNDVSSSDYESTRYLARPGHADYTGFLRYDGYNDYRGGGHFSGRLTAPLVFAGALAKLILMPMGIRVGSHIREICGIADAPLDHVSVSDETLEKLAEMPFPVLDPAQGEKMQAMIREAKSEQDSAIECAVVGLPAGRGTPGPDCAESLIARQVFAVPAVKGIEFGAGFSLSRLRGSEANDPFVGAEGAIRTETNHNGGINGGITNGMPLVFSVVIKPTPSIGLPQRTVDIRTGDNKEIQVRGRHDPCIVHRALPAVEAAAALAVCEILDI